MSGTVKRNYDSTRRQELARQGRARILAVARSRFLRDGYAATTMAAIAADADVSPQTVTKHFGNKPGLVKALFDVALVGDDEAVPLAARPWITAIHDEPDPHRKLRLYAEALATMVPRTAPIQLLAREAVGDPAVAEVWEQTRVGRLLGMTDLAENLAAGDHLRDGVSMEQARDVLWAYSSPELYDLLVLERGWTTDAYAEFIALGAIASLLPTRRRRSGAR
jgi:AcrR family transcriptional regulator